MQAAEAKLTRRMAGAVLALESVVLFLSTPVMIQVSDVSAGPAIAVGLGLAVLSLLLSGMLRFAWGFVLGSVLQVAAVALGLVVPAMFVLGGIFALLWVMALVLGRRVDTAKAQQDPA
jgi:hypothetical protein